MGRRFLKVKIAAQTIVKKEIPPTMRAELCHIEDLAISRRSKGFGLPEAKRKIVIQAMRNPKRNSGRAAIIADFRFILLNV